MTIWRFGKDPLLYYFPIGNYPLCSTWFYFCFSVFVVLSAVLFAEFLFACCLQRYYPRDRPFNTLFSSILFFFVYIFLSFGFNFCFITLCVLFVYLHWTQNKFEAFVLLEVHNKNKNTTHKINPSRVPNPCFCFSSIAVLSP